MADRSQQTEKATPRRLEKARREGQFPVSREFVAALQFLAFVSVLVAFAPQGFSAFLSTFRVLLDRSFGNDLTPAELRHLVEIASVRIFVPLAIAGGGLMAITVLTQLVTTQMGFATKKLSPDFARLNPARRLRDLPRQNLSQFFQALILLPVFLWAVYVVARDRVEQFMRLPFLGLHAGVQLIAVSVEDLLWKATGLFLVFGIIDLFRQRRRHQKDLMMSKQEIREEAKESDGNPMVKSRIRRIQRDLLRRRMMSEVPKATAVIVNPTHFAVAIRYRPEGMAAPLVVAKGKNYLALRIRQKAIENQVPIVENPPLAQSLYKSVEVGQEIPPALYRAVAEVLAYIFRLTSGRVR